MQGAGWCSRENSESFFWVLGARIHTCQQLDELNVVPVVTVHPGVAWKGKRRDKRGCVRMIAAIFSIRDNHVRQEDLRVEEILQRYARCACKWRHIART